MWFNVVRFDRRYGRQRDQKNTSCLMICESPVQLLALFRRSRGQAELLPLCPGTSDVNFFGNLNGVVDLNAEVFDSALDLGRR